MERAELLFLDAVARGIRGERTDWEPVPAEDFCAMLRLAERHKLLPLTVDAVCACPNALRDPSFAAYRQAARGQVLRQTQKDAALAPVLERLRRAELPILVVKGSVCRTVYPNGALRISADEDLLAEETRFAEACALLAEAGLRADPGADPGAAFEIGWHSPDGLLYVELHRTLFAPDSGPFGLLQTVFTDVFVRAEEYPTDFGPLRSLSPHDHLLYLLLHAMKHFIRTGFGLRQICDVGLWARRWAPAIDWPLLRRQAEAVRGADFCAALFAAAEESLGLDLPLPDDWRAGRPDPAPMLQDLLDGGVYGSATGTRTHTARITQDAVAAQRAGRRGGLRTALFPAAKSLEEDYPVLKEHPALLPLIWQKRLAAYLKRAAVTEGEDPAQTVRLGRQRLELLRRYGILNDKDK